MRVSKGNRAQKDSSRTREGRRTGAFSSLAKSPPKSRVKITLLCRARRGNGWPDPSSLLLAAATSYFIPRLHNRLFVSRFYPRSESQPSPLLLRAPRGYLSADGIERVGGSEGMVKKCPEDIVNLLGPPQSLFLYIYSATEPRSICF